MSEQDLNVTDAMGLALYPKSRLFDCFFSVAGLRGRLCVCCTFNLRVWFV